MKRLVSAAIACAAAAGLALAGIALFASHGEAANGPRIMSALGVTSVHGQRTFVEVSVALAPGEDAQAAATAALSEQGARPATRADIQSANYATNGLIWDQFNDSNPGNDFVVQNYNPASDPTGGGGQGALTASENTWTNVATSRFAFSFGGTTSRCPSLVKECPGPQSYDGNNDVGWAPLSCNRARCTLGVTWYGAAEADMALNSGTAWHAGATACTNVNGSYDAQTVFTHENGHVVGLDHSSDPSALMYAYYSGAHCALGQDDIDGVTFLYPEAGVTPVPTPTATVGATPTATATPSAFCPPGQHRKGLC